MLVQIGLIAAVAAAALPSAVEAQHTHPVDVVVVKEAVTVGYSDRNVEGCLPERDNRNGQSARRSDYSDTFDGLPYQVTPHEVTPLYVPPSHVLPGYLPYFGHTSWEARSQIQGALSALA
jgi:hypothetical protein